MKVRNMISSNSNTIANQIIIDGDNGHQVFQSYDSIIAIKQAGDNPVLLDKYYWDYSTTTSKYRNQFLNETKKETIKKINAGEYILTDLNK
jgi:hypothetical protein